MYTLAHAAVYDIESHPQTTNLFRTDRSRQNDFWRITVPLVLFRRKRLAVSMSNQFGLGTGELSRSSRSI